MQLAKGFYTWLEAKKRFNKLRRMLMFVANHTSRISKESAWRRWADASYAIEQARLAGVLADKEAQKRAL